MLVVANKADLLTEEQLVSLPHTQSAIIISAKHKRHIDELKHKIYTAAVKHQLSGDETLVTNIRHPGGSSKTEATLIRLSGGIGAKVTSDFLAMDIKQALHYLGEITGAVTTDDLLDNIFQ